MQVFSDCPFPMLLESWGSIALKNAPRANVTVKYLDFYTLTVGSLYVVGGR